MIRFAAFIMAAVLTQQANAVEVSTIVSCKPDGETWLCAAYQNETLQVFRSDYYQTKVEFKGLPQPQNAPGEPATAPVVEADVIVNPQKGDDGLPTGRYTIQLLACRAVGCQQRIQSMQGIPGSQHVELKVDAGIMHILITGGYESYKDAQKAAAELMTRYSLSEKPWVRTLDSVRHQRLNP